MIAYEYFWRGAAGEEHTIGILPERRRIPKRITRDSIMRWGKTALGRKSGISPKSLYFNKLNYK